LNHILKNSEQLLGVLDSTVTGERRQLVTADVSDFFIRGDQLRIAKIFSKILPVAFRNGAVNALLHVLHHQYVSCTVVNDVHGYDRVFRSLRGSGMGLSASRELADWDFFQLVEMEYATSPGIQTKHKIDFHFRYCDDIIWCSKLDKSWPQFLEKFRSKCKPDYDIVLSNFSTKSMPFLDVNVMLQNGRYAYAPYVKPTAQKRWLASDSAHTYMVHANWPSAYVQRLSRRCSSEWAFVREKSIFLEQLSITSPKHPGMDAALKINRHGHIRARVQPKPKYMWWPVEWHPVYKNAKFNSILKSVFEHWQYVFTNLGRNLPLLQIQGIQVAWKKCSPHLQHWIRC